MRGRVSDRSPFEFAVALSEEIVLAIYVDHAVLQHALPLVLYAGNFIISAEYNVGFASVALLTLLLHFRVRVIEI